MSRADQIISRIDWISILLYVALVFIGWLSIYASVHDSTANQDIWDLSINSGRQLLFIASCSILIIGIMALDVRFYEVFAYVIFAAVMVLLLLTLFIGKEVGGNKAWIGIGSFGVQPSEFAKLATALAVAKLIDSIGFKMTLTNQIVLLGLMGLPMGIILLQKDAGTALVFLAFLPVFFREGMPPFLMIAGIAMAAVFIITLLAPKLYIHAATIAIATVVYLLGRKRRRKRFLSAIVGITLLVMGAVESVDYIVSDVLKPHQQDRIKALINPNADPLGYGWNVTQSKIAIGSGGLFGKGFLKGTQTKFDFVPEQSTDFIFCTIGEEYGWVGCAVVIGLFTALLLRIIFIAERQKSHFAIAYGYSVATIFFFHFTVNIGMTIGLLPVIGIPLPFISYGGSSLWGSTMLLFILLKLDAHRGEVLKRF